MLVSSDKLEAQVQTALPFLRITSSVEGNGMGGISASLITDNAMAPLANPGQLGVMALNNYFTRGVYSPKTQWLPPFQISDLTFNASSVNLGLDISKVSAFPFPLSFGIGLSAVTLNLGKFAVTGSDPTVIRTFDAYESSTNTSLAIGIDYFLKVGLGISLKNVTSSLGPNLFDTTREATATVSTTDVGLIAMVPVVDILSKFRNEPMEISPNTSPLFDITVGYARRNLGNKLVVYIDPAQGDPLPRTASLGLGWKIGLISHAIPQGWEVVSFTLAREAEDVLVSWLQDTLFISNGTFAINIRSIYQDGAGDIQFFKNIILGESNGEVVVRKGWQINLAEILYIRGGSFFGQGLGYFTSGYGIALTGMLKFTAVMNHDRAPSPIFQFALDHLDVRIDHAVENAGYYSPRNGTTYTGLNFILR